MKEIPRALLEKKTQTFLKLLPLETEQIGP